MLCIVVRKKIGLSFQRFICNFMMIFQSSTMASLFDKKMRYLGCDGGNACTFGSKRENVQNVGFTGILNDLCKHLTYIESGRSLTTLVIRVSMNIFI